MNKTGAEITMEVLKEQGVDTVFGYPGGAALFLYDALYKYKDDIKHILTAHEQGATHAADGYARATGKTGVVIATSGPGATNLVTGIATAFMDSIPMVVITANVMGNLIGKDAFQEIYISGITLHITKHNYFINDVNDLPDALRNAFRIANQGRKGPVLVDITKDVTAQLAEFTPIDEIVKNQGAAEETAEEVKKTVYREPQKENVAKKATSFAKRINAAKRPVIMVGGGVIASGAENEINRLMDAGGIPTVHTLMGAGAVPYDKENNFGFVGMHGSYAANKAVHEADLIIAAGTRFSDRVALNPKGFAPKAKILQIDIDRSEIGKNVEVYDSIIGDCKEVLRAILPKINQENREKWTEKIKGWNAEKPMGIKAFEGNINPQEIIKTVCDLVPEDTIYVTDVGQHQMWAAQYIKHRYSRHFLTSGGLGTMGYGYGASIGAAVSRPGEKIIHFTGDGSLHMNLNEASTAVSNELPIITIIMNNRVLGMVYQWQTSFYDGRYSHTVPERKTDFVKIIEGFGGVGYRAKNIDEFRDAMKKAMKAKGPVWIDCDISRQQKVLPMISNGQTVEETIFE